MMPRRVLFCIGLFVVSSVVLFQHTQAQGTVTDYELEAGAALGTGKFGQGFVLDGTDDVVRIPRSPALEPAAEVSISLWMKSVRPGGYILAKGADGCTAASYALYASGGGVAFYITSSSGSFTLSPASSANVWDGEWHHIVGTYDGSAVRLYEDGVEAGSGGGSSASGALQYGLSSGNDVLLGSYEGCAISYAGGVDEVRIYDRALSLAEAKQLFQATGTLPSSGLAGSWLAESGGSSTGAGFSALETEANARVQTADFGQLPTVTAIKSNTYEWQKEVLVQELTIDLASVANFLSFGPYCNPQVCGGGSDFSQACTVGRVGPSFALNTINPGISTLELPSPVGLRATSAKLQYGRPQVNASNVPTSPTVPRDFAYWSGTNNASQYESMLASAPVVDRTGALIFSFAPPVELEPVINFWKPRAGLSGSDPNTLCGLGITEAESYSAQFGSIKTGDLPTNLTATITWEGAARIGTTPTPVVPELNGAAQGGTIVPSQPTVSAVEPFQQQDGRWGNSELTGADGIAHRFRDVGSVATSLATLFFGIGDTTVTPPIMGQLLIQSGWQPGKGVAWDHIRAAATSRTILTTRVPLNDALGQLTAGQPVFTTYTADDIDRSIVLTDFNSDADQFNAIDPGRGEITIDWTELLKGRPWFLQATSR